MTTETPACIDQWELYDGIDLEDDAGNLTGQMFPYEDEAKSLCAECPVIDWCRTKNYMEPYTIVAGKTPAERRNRRKK